MMFARERDPSGDLTALREMIDRHLLANYLDIPGAPLMLCVSGAPGVGKSFTIKRHLAERSVEAKELSASSLAHHMEGVAVKPLIRCYRDASAIMAVRPAALVIDDIDRSIMSNFATAGHTVHSQLLTGLLMDLCDDPRHIVSEDAGSSRSMVDVERVPIVLTANAVGGLDSALTRPQRMTIFTFHPTVNDRRSMLREALHPQSDFGIDLTDAEVSALEKKYRRQPVAFFADLFANLLSQCIVETSGRDPFADPATIISAESRRLWRGELGKRVSEFKYRDVLKAAERLQANRAAGLLSKKTSYD